jgi:ATP-dependent DNA ligase
VATQPNRELLLDAEVAAHEGEQTLFSRLQQRLGVATPSPEQLVAQIGFAEWTRDGRLRQPRFLGLRDDKPAVEVVRDRPQPSATASSQIWKGVGRVRHGTGPRS